MPAIIMIIAALAFRQSGRLSGRFKMCIRDRVKDAGGVMLRGGAYKPRTSPYAFQGMGTEGILAMVKAREKTGLPIVSELMSADKIDEFVEMCIRDRIILQHHERWDGGGYPYGLKASEICEEARVLALADAYDAMICRRRYHDPVSYTHLDVYKRQGLGCAGGFSAAAGDYRWSAAGFHLWRLPERNGSGQ